jgi:hypothetical protein
VQGADQNYALRVRRVLPLLLVTVVACRTGSDVELRRAIVTREHVEAAIEYERALSQRYDVLPAEGEEWFEIRRGTIPVIVVAGHATAQTREGERKVADRGTGSLAVALHELTGATVIHTIRRSPSDPNFYDDNAFKTALAELIREVRPAVVLDLHGSHSYRPYDVDFGIMGGRSLLGKDELMSSLIAILREEGMLNLSRDYFAAARNQTVTKFASSLGVPSMQLEISSTRLDPSRDTLTAHRFAQILQALVRYITNAWPR